jgi:hypothetical protein
MANYLWIATGADKSATTASNWINIGNGETPPSPFSPALTADDVTKPLDSLMFNADQKVDLQTGGKVTGSSADCLMSFPNDSSVLKLTVANYAGSVKCNSSA